MCGLVGMIGKIGVSEEKMFKQLLHLDVLRGVHSTGVASVTTTGSTYIAKEVGTPTNLFDTKRFDNAMRNGNKLLIGHNRAATIGKVNRTNAHPFECGDIIGCHNGTLRMQSLLLDYEDFSVDSENIMHSIDLEGAEETIKNLNGAFALTWYNKKDNTFNMVRNKERTLFYCYSKDRKTLFWASEEWMILVAAKRCDIEVCKVTALPIGKLLTIPVSKDSFMNSKEIEGTSLTVVDMYEAPLVKKPYTGHSKNLVPFKRKDDIDHSIFVGKKVKMFVKGTGVNKQGTSYLLATVLGNPHVNMRMYYEMGTNNWNKFNNPCVVVEGTVKRVGKDGSPYGVIDLRSVNVVKSSYQEDKEEKTKDMYVGYNSRLLTESEFLQASDKGCAWCSDVVSTKDAPDIKWISHNEFVCLDCAYLPAVKEFLCE